MGTVFLPQAANRLPLLVAHNLAKLSHLIVGVNVTAEVLPALSFGTLNTVVIFRTFLTENLF